MAETTNLKLPLLAAAQAQKHVTHNEALAVLDATVQARVLSIGLTTPPGGSDGDSYIPGSGATGAWDGWDWNVVFMLDGAWRKVVPEAGWCVWNDDDGARYVYDAEAYWRRLDGEILVEVSEPDPPVAGRARLYVEGTDLKLILADGAVYTVTMTLDT